MVQSRGDRRGGGRSIGGGGGSLNLLILATEQSRGRGSVLKEIKRVYTTELQRKAFISAFHRIFVVYTSFIKFCIIVYTTEMQRKA